MISNERIVGLSFKVVEIINEIRMDNRKTLDQQKLSYNNQRLIVLKKLAQMLKCIADHRLSNGDYIEED